MRVFVDDVRNAPAPDWKVIRTIDGAIALLMGSGNKIKYLSLDHDMGDALGRSGYDIACVVESLINEGRINPDITITIHSANPSGVMRMANVTEHCLGELPWPKGQGFQELNPLNNSAKHNLKLS